ncbi:MAG TPA: hypothetical protein PKH33_03450 [bacterium]|nr:hypothetical protein [bacterium]
MPEITSVENIRSKLSEFQNSIIAISEIKSQLDKHLQHVESHIKEFQTVIELAKATEKIVADSNRAWEKLRHETNEVNKTAKSTNEKSISQLKDVENKIAAAESRVASEIKDSFKAYEEKITEYDASITERFSFIREKADHILGQAQMVETAVSSAESNLKNSIDEWKHSQAKSVEIRINDLQNDVIKKISSYVADLQNAMQKMSITNEKEAQARILELSDKHGALIDGFIETQKSEQSSFLNKLSNSEDETKKTVQSFVEEQASAFKTFKSLIQSKHNDFEKTNQASLLSFMNRHETILKSVNTQMDTYSNSSQLFTSKIESLKHEMVELLKKIRLQQQKENLAAAKSSEDMIAKLKDEAIAEAEVKTQQLINQVKTDCNNRILAIEDELEQIKKRGVIGKFFGSK